MRSLNELCISVDEWEAIRLADLLGLEQEKAAEQMGISQPSLHRTLELAHRKIADALVNGKAIRIEGGEYVIMDAGRKFKCSACGNVWEEPYGSGRPSKCPKCSSENLHRAPEDRGYVSRGRRGCRM